MRRIKIRSKKPKLKLLEQWIDIRRLDGKTVSTFYPPNDELEQLRLDMDPPPDLIYRRMNFIGPVPLEYTWTAPREQGRLNGGHCLQRLKPEDWLWVLDQERNFGNGHAVSGCDPQPRPEQFGPCPCFRCTSKSRAKAGTAHSNTIPRPNIPTPHLPGDNPKIIFPDS
jgi:hypothetical protein